MLLEVYARIEGYPNYAISNLGIVLSIKNQIILKPGKNSNGYHIVVLCNNKKKKTHKVHRLVAQAYFNKIDNKDIVDHIDNNPLNNRIDNLRYCNLTENNRNSKIPLTNTSGIKGVCYDIKRKKWNAKISLNNKTINIGRFETLEEAKIARQNKSRELFGDFLNDCEL